MPVVSRVLPLLALALAAAFGAAAELPSFTLSARPAPDAFSVSANALSRDGTLVNVSYYDSQFTRQNATWTPENGFALRPNAPTSVRLEFNALTPDGRVAVGQMGDWAATWEANGAPSELDHPAVGSASFASCGSFDGTTIGGYVFDGPFTHPVAWRGGLVRELQAPETGRGGVTAISDDGRTFVGMIEPDYDHSTACRWDAQGHRTDLVLPAPYTGSSAFPLAVSADGTITLLNVTTPNDGQRAFLASPGGIRSLGYVPGNPGYSVYPRAMSADGTVAVGAASGPDGDRPFLWDKVHGMRDLRAALEANGLGPDLGAAILRSAAGVTVRPSGAIVVTGSATLAGEERIYSAVIPPEASFDALGHLVGGGISEATAISADGESVVGYSNSTNGDRAFRWTATRGLVDLGAGAGFAGGVSANGGIVAGNGPDGGAYRWREDGNGRWLGADAHAYGVSADGRVTVGSSLGPDDVEHAYRWKDEATERYVTYIGGRVVPSRARAASADGAVFVGESDFTTIDGVDVHPHGFRWDDQGHQLDLGDLPGGDWETHVSGVSGDGGTIVGDASGANGTQAFVWTETTGMRALGGLPGITESRARGISPDGTVVVGAYRSGGVNRCFVWDAVHGMRDLRDLIVDGGGLAAANWDFENATSVTIDSVGRVYVVGAGFGPDGYQAFRATLPARKFNPGP